jgi:hypothetical protein
MGLHLLPLPTSCVCDRIIMEITRLATELHPLEPPSSVIDKLLFEHVSLSAALIPSVERSHGVPSARHPHEACQLRWKMRRRLLFFPNEAFMRTTRKQGRGGEVHGASPRMWVELDL